MQPKRYDLRLLREIVEDNRIEIAPAPAATSWGEIEAGEQGNDPRSTEEVMRQLEDDLGTLRLIVYGGVFMALAAVCVVGGIIWRLMSHGRFSANG